MAEVRDPHDPASAPPIERVKLVEHGMCCGPRLTPVQKNWKYVHSVETQLCAKRDTRSPDIPVEFRHLRARNLNAASYLGFATARVVS